MEFRLNGTSYVVDPAQARIRILSAPPDQVRTHWVEIDGRRWPAKQAFEVATGIPRGEYISHTAVRLLARMGFLTSQLPNETGARPGSSAGTPRHAAPIAEQAPPATEQEAAAAFETLDRFLQAHPLTAEIAALETSLRDAGVTEATDVSESTPLVQDVLRAALLVRERVGVLDSLIHAAVITHTLPRILLKGERLVSPPSLGAGNARRPFDLETNLRVAEFKVAQWKGADGLRQRGVMADLVGLTLDETGRRRQLFVVGQRPKRFLQTSNRPVAGVLSKAAHRLRQDDLLDPDITVAEFTAASNVEVIDLSQWFPHLIRE